MKLVHDSLPKIFCNEKPRLSILRTSCSRLMQVAECLSRMALAGQVSGDGKSVSVSVPPTRSDVLHACDVAEVCLKPAG